MLHYIFIWTRAWQNLRNDICTQQRCRSACASLIRVFSWNSMNSQGSIVYSCEQRRFQSDCANAQAYPSLCWAHIILKFFSRSSFVMCFWRVRHLCDKTDAKRICFPTVWLNKFYFQASLELQSENNWPYSILFNSKALKNCLFRVKYQSNKGRVSTNFFFFSFF